MSAPLTLSAQSVRTTDSPITYFVQKALETPGLISFAAGLVDEESLPARDVAAAVEAIMADPAAARAALQYGSTQGLPALREKILRHICSADDVQPGEIGLTPDDVVITTGSQQLLYLLGEALLNEGDIVITEAPSYFVYHSLLQSQGIRVLTVPMDPGGMDLNALEGLLANLDRAGELNRVKLIYTVDYFQNPTGLTLLEARRPRLVEIARQYSRTQRILILEDAAYRELRFQGDDLPSIKKFDETNEYVVYAGTFSKPCAPGLKTGYALLPRDLVGPISNLKGNHDFGSNNLAQHILNRLMESGAYDRHVANLQKVYRAKLDLMLATLDEEFTDFAGVQWTHPFGGLYVWLTFPDHVDAGPDGPLAASALKHGVLYVPGVFGHVAESGEVPRNELRLCYGISSHEQIVEGIRRLREACRGLEEPIAKRRDLVGAV